jgi:hypothetical protein
MMAAKPPVPPAGAPTAPGAMPPPPAATPPAPAATPPLAGMMSGVLPAGPGAPELKDKKPVTTFGRYVKVLLSSNEFLFVN